ncbi:hypothetical protein [Methylobacterium haplocladii]|uniref:Uncharacterized protein n=1 Tax=Methylobacterium haplocladii TaxID=1176176 RepID=A0A512IP40_9HYPH|nr:hypothetical protein [Methylobacterium haplocladii]GEO99465.1 hypothetical protein MHA02_18530 [Methylobacterium haplocladii]GJD83294.1 hypothetical protein HPGCJGGD_1160 [Methylobacterium haplocladii]GLS58942.1 hypothetical protein GCM10007887_16080 [Methylobacterium haplocladii]
MSSPTCHHRDLNEIRASLAGLTVETKPLRIGWLLSQKYDPDQPREPAGQPGGGRWTSGDPTAAGPLAGGYDPETTGSIGGGSAPSTTQEEVVTADGSRVLSIRIRSNPHAAWDEQHTVTAPDGTRTVFETSGLTQTIRDGESGEILGRSTLTEAGAEPFVQTVGGRSTVLRRSPGSLGSAALAIYNALVQTGNALSNVIFAAPATEYRSNADIRIAGYWVGAVEQEELNSACPRNGEVQSIADRIAAHVRSSGIYLSPQDLGNRVHKLIAEEINSMGDPDLIAEISYVDPAQDKVSYGTAGSIRVDILERSAPATVCVYDHKTGKKGLTPKRAAEIAIMVQRNFPGARRIILIEVRPKS